MLDHHGRRSTEREKGRTLTVSDPLVNTAVQAIAFEDFDIASTTRWGNKLAADARLWRMANPPSDRGRISKRDAEHIWRSMFPARTLNSLGRYRRGGGK